MLHLRVLIILVICTYPFSGTTLIPIVQTHAQTLQSSRTATITICSPTVTPTTCQTTQVGPDGLEFTGHGFQSILVASPQDLSGQYSFLYWEDGETNSTRMVWNFYPTAVYRATYGKPVLHGANDFFLATVGIFFVVMIVAGLVGSWKFRGRKDLKRQKARKNS